MQSPSVRVRSRVSFLATSTAAAGLLLAACADSPAQVESDQNALTTVSWVRVNDCATSIGVSPDDTIWISACSAGANGDIWYMRDKCSGFTCDQDWHITKGQGSYVNVSNSGSPMMLTAAGVAYSSNSDPPSARIVVPDGTWSRTKTPMQCNGNFQRYVVGNNTTLEFETPTRSVALGNWHYFMTECSADHNGNSPIFRGDATGALSATVGAASRLTMFGSGFTPSQQRTLWTLDASGGMTTYNESTGTFTAAPSPPSYTFSFTDHFALANDGVYRWDDGTLAWSRYIGNTTPTGAITELAYASAVPVTMADGTSATFGPSSLWAIDRSGTIYRAVESAVVR